MQSRGTAGLLLGILLTLCDAALAAVTEKADLSFSGATYSYTFVAVVEGSAADVHAIATDYEHTAQLNDDVVESRVLAREGEHELTRLLRLEQCILLVCFDLIFVETVTETADRIITTIVPGASTFTEGSAAWHIEAVDATHTRITVSAIQTPNFWIPPVLGPLVLKRVFLKEVAETCASIERLARERAAAAAR